MWAAPEMEHILPIVTALNEKFANATRYVTGAKTLALRSASIGMLTNFSQSFEMPYIDNDKGLDYEHRWVDVISDPSNALVPRCRHAGKVIVHKGRRCVVMSTGVVVMETGYYGNFSRVLQSNLGVHEAAEERVFSAIVDDIASEAKGRAAGAVVVELGAYWAYYSIWFLRAIPRSRAFLVEAMASNRKMGVINLWLNDVPAKDYEYVLGNVTGSWWTAYAQRKKGMHMPHRVDFMLVDIQGWEADLVPTVAHAISRGELEVGYIMVGTHSQSVHHKVLASLTKIAGLRVIASLDVDEETFFFDGLVVATSVAEQYDVHGRRIRGLPYFGLGNRRRTPTRNVTFAREAQTQEPCEMLPSAELEARLQAEDWLR